MSLKLLILLVSVITSQVSCANKGSLAFVIDNTASMGDVISEVKTMINLNLDVFLHNATEDVVVVTFNDPDTKLVTRTQSAQELTQDLDSIQVGGGGDCPEMALSGIKLALEESHSNSNLFVFTDASAKDFALFDEVKTLCQEKQSQITFILTGSCNGIGSESNSAYEHLAEACNGQMLKVSTEETIKEAPEYLKVELLSKKIIVSKVVPSHQWSQIKFFKNKSFDYVVVSASGTDVELDVVNQDQTSLLEKGTQIIWLDSVKILKLSDLPNGEITVKVTGKSFVNVSILGKTLELKPSVKPDN